MSFVKINVINLHQTGENLRVVIHGSDSAHPVCEHGPALLFERHSGNECQQFYACSAYRDSKDCPLHIPVDETKPATYNTDFLVRHPKNATKITLDVANKWPAVRIILMFFSRKKNQFDDNIGTFPI